MYVPRLSPVLCLLNVFPAQTFGSAIVSLNTQGSQIIVGDIARIRSLYCLQTARNRLLIFADDSQPGGPPLSCTVSVRLQERTTWTSQGHHWNGLTELGQVNYRQNSDRTQTHLRFSR